MFKISLQFCLTQKYFCSGNFQQFCLAEKVFFYIFWLKIYNFAFWQQFEDISSAKVSARGGHKAMKLSRFI